MHESKKVPPRVIRTGETAFGWRHVKGVAVVRLVVAAWLLCLGSILLAFGYWWGAFLIVAAGAAGWLAYQMPRWKVALDALKNVGLPQ